jgi:hypothetical protein
MELIGCPGSLIGCPDSLLSFVDASHRLLAGVSVLLPAEAVHGQTDAAAAVSAHPAVSFVAGEAVDADTGVA